MHLSPQINNLREEEILRPHLERVLVTSTHQSISTEEDGLDPGALLPLCPDPLTLPPRPCTPPLSPLAVVPSALHHGNHRRRPLPSVPHGLPSPA